MTHRAQITSVIIIQWCANIQVIILNAGILKKYRYQLINHVLRTKMIALNKIKKVTKRQISPVVASSSTIEVGLSTREIELKLKSKKSKFNQLSLA